MAHRSAHNQTAKPQLSARRPNDRSRHGTERCTASSAARPTRRTPGAWRRTYSRSLASALGSAGQARRISSSVSHSGRGRERLPVWLRNSTSYSGGGPTIIEAITFRMRGHEEASGVKYIPNKLFQKWEKKDPIVQFEKYLRKKNIFNKKLKEDIIEKIQLLITPAFDKAIKAPLPNSSISNELSDVYCPKTFQIISPGHKVNKQRMVDAISKTLSIKMETDDKIIILGQDIAEYGGVFKVTEGFLNKFGKNRVRNTPIIESGAIGATLGLALSGFKPIIEMQFSDFITCGFNQVVNNLAKTKESLSELDHSYLKARSGMIRGRISSSDRELTDKILPTPCFGYTT